MLFNSSLVVRILFLLLLSTGFSQALAQNFPLPESLKPNVEFWKRVYSEIDGGQGFMHDTRNLSIVYETITVPKNGSRRQRKRIVDAARQRIKKQLERISTTRLDKLSERDRKIRRMFPASATPGEIRAARRYIRFQLGQADKFEQAIQRSGYYTHYIGSRLNQAGLPLELAALPFVESSFNVRANSHVGAAGIWQFMPATGRRFMKVNHVIDERYDPYRASDAAVKLLKYNYSILKSWPLALTAYNHGVGGMRRAIRKTGTTDIGVIVKKYRSRTFGFASRNFYAEFLAALAVSRNAVRYFPGIQPYAPQDLVRFQLDHYVPAKALASAMGVKLGKLRLHNLALREPVWDGEKRLPARYELRIPRHMVTGRIDRQLAQIPQAAKFSKQVLDKTYKVRRGDSLSRIASLYRIKVNDLVMMNNLRSRHRIRVGQVLYLPQKGKLVTPPKPVIKKPGPVIVATVEAPQRKLVSVTPKALAVNTPGEEAADKKIVQQKKEIPVIEELAIAEVKEPLVEDEVLDSVQQISATDPAEYSVETDNTIEVQAAETLGHYADWLSIKTQRLRQINRMAFHKPVVIGKRLKLDFSRVNPQAFEGKRLAYHKQLEDSFFAKYRIEGTTDYRIRRGDSLWVISNRHKNTPLWLIRQHNPDENFSGLKPGDKITLPVIVRKI